MSEEMKKLIIDNQEFEVVDAAGRERITALENSAPSGGSGFTPVEKNMLRQLFGYTTYNQEDADEAAIVLANLNNLWSTTARFNYVTGTFEGTTEGAAIDVDIPYDGEGYPIILVIEPTGGFRGNATFADTIQRYAISGFFACKGVINSEPTYASTDEANSALVSVGFKNSTTSATQYSTQSGANVNTYRNQSSNSTATTTARIKDNSTLSVFIASNSYGFMAGVEYTYHIIYSN